MAFRLIVCLLAVSGAWGVSVALCDDLTRPELVSRVRREIVSVEEAVSNVVARGTLSRKFSSGRGDYAAEFACEALDGQLLVELTYDAAGKPSAKPDSHVYSFGDGFGFTLRRDQDRWSAEGGGSLPAGEKSRLQRDHRFGRFLEAAFMVGGRRLLEVLEDPATNILSIDERTADGKELVVVKLGPGPWLVIDGLKQRIESGEVLLLPGSRFAVHSYALDVVESSANGGAENRYQVAAEVTLRSAEDVGGRVLPERVVSTTTFQGDGSEMGAQTIDVAEFTTFEFGSVVADAFLPSRFGVSDRLVRVSDGAGWLIDSRLLWLAGAVLGVVVLTMLYRSMRFRGTRESSTTSVQ